MRVELKEKITEENKYYDLLQGNPQYRLQGYDMKKQKVAVGIIQGEPTEYKWEVDHLNFMYFDSWKDAYMKLPGHYNIRKAVKHYRERIGTEEEQQAGIELVRTVRNGIENLGGISCEELYNDRASFNRLLNMAAAV